MKAKLIVNQWEALLTDKYKYKSISLRCQTMDKIKHLSETLEPGNILSNAKTVEKLISDSFEKENHKEHIDNERNTKQYCKA
jgi:hypothetical protein